jgi:hypothetical protein
MMRGGRAHIESHCTSHFLFCWFCWTLCCERKKFGWGEEKWPLVGQESLEGGRRGHCGAGEERGKMWPLVGQEILEGGERAKMWPLVVGERKDLASSGAG